MYERKAPDPNWTAELEWWWDWMDTHLGEMPDADVDPAGWARHASAWRRFWRWGALLGRAQDEDDLEDLLDKAWGDA